LSSLAIPPPGLPTGSKADASFEATGELSTWHLPFEDLAWRVGKNTDRLLLSPENRWNSTAMDDLTFTLRQLCLRNRDGSHATQADRQRSLNLAARQLREAGFRQMQATSLKGKHVEALLQRWQAEGLSVGTLKNRMAHLRWWAEKVGKAGILPADNTKLGIPERRYVTNESRAKELGNRLDRITDPLRSHEPALAVSIWPAAGRVHQVPAPLCRPWQPHRHQGVMGERRA
jgi:hypothetical protein